VEIYEIDQSSGESDIQIDSALPFYRDAAKQKPPAPAGDGGFLITA
jgi:hypothetical protein